MGLLELYHHVNDELADKRTNDWMFVTTPIPLTIITTAYLYFVLICGPRYMSKKPAYSLRTFVKIDNIFKIIANAWIVYRILNNNWYLDTIFFCDRITYTYSPQDMEFARIGWYAFIFKIFDYTEACVFVLRKKQNQISFLHLYHHVSVTYMSWMHVKYFCSGMSLTTYLVNCSVHVVMYSYYLLSAMGSQMRKLLMPIKPMITVIQMAQLVFAIGMLFPNIYYGCPEAEFALIALLVNAVIYLALFYNFFRKSYRKKTKQT